MRVLCVVPYPTEAPSNRLRVEQYFPYLREHGITPILRPFMTSLFYNIRYSPGDLSRKVASFGMSTLSRMSDVIRASRADVILVHREAFPFGGPFFEEAMARTNVPIVFDFDDAIYLPNSADANRFVTYLKRPHKTARAIELSSWVIAGNENLKSYASRYNSNITVIPTPVDTDYFAPRTEAPREDRVVIGWIGSNTTAPYLRMLVRALDQITEKYPHVDVRVVGGSYVPPIVHNLQVRRWDLEQELDELHGFDIGIMPMPDTEWTRGKCGFKALLYMSVGIPPVCSPVGVTTDILQDGYNGLLATTTERPTAGSAPPSGRRWSARPGTARPPAATASPPPRHNGPDAACRSPTTGRYGGTRGPPSDWCRRRNPHRTRRPSLIPTSSDYMSNRPQPPRAVQLGVHLGPFRFR
jgi:glycosyltransferase involved in cell wall biosynthesis